MCPVNEQSWRAEGANSMSNIRKTKEETDAGKSH